MNSTNKAYQRDLFLLDFIDSNCMEISNTSIAEYDEAISEYSMLIEDRLQHNNLKEVAKFLLGIDNTVPFKTLDELLDSVPNNEVIGNNMIKAWHYINRPDYKTIICSISGGSDSDIILDICCKCDKDRKIRYVFFDTGIEYQATKDHLDFLENKYNIKISRYRSCELGKSIPTSCKEYGQPFLSKQVSEFIQRLQKHNFKWEDKSFKELVKEYPNCVSALKWWCEEYGDNSHFNISRNKYLKEFIIDNPPNFKISNKCCQYSKKIPVHKVHSFHNAELSIFGVRKSEGGARSTAYKSCFSSSDDTDQYRPIFWYKDPDKKEYEEHYGIQHSKCYMEYGLKRTGCIGCPFGKNLEFELDVAKQYEPKVYKAINNIFKDSYEYTRKYREFVKQKKLEGKNEFQQINIYDLFDKDNDYIYK